MINVSVFKVQFVKDNNFDTIVTEHRYETSNKKKPKIQNCYAEKRRNTSEKLVLNLGKYINTSFKNDYSNENALNLSSTQWNNYLTYCQWFNLREQNILHLLIFEVRSSFIINIK